MLPPVTTVAVVLSKNPVAVAVRVAVLTERGRGAREQVVQLTLTRTPFAGCDPADLDRLAGIPRRVLDRADC
ncbi:hypothetical protein ABZ569_20650 [Streptomyces albus]|uniref:hypothetical protein n=1 Tax=Streptomyces albus TaxID=1888 RepID=UPI003407820D